MTRPLDITARQVTALCIGAKKAGYAPVIQIGKFWVRLVPVEYAIPPNIAADVDEPKKGYF